MYQAHRESEQKAYQAGLNAAKKEEENRMIRNNEMNEAYETGAGDAMSVVQQMNQERAGIGELMSNQQPVVPEGNPPVNIDEETIQYGSEETAQNQAAAEQVANVAVEIALKNGIPAEDKESIFQVVGQILTQELGQDGMIANKDKVQVVGNMAIDMASQTLANKALAGGFMSGQGREIGPIDGSVPQNGQVAQAQNEQQMIQEEPQKLPAGLY